MNPRQAPHRRRKVTIGARIILRPAGESIPPVHATTAPESAAASEGSEQSFGVLGIHQPCENPLGTFLVIRRKRDFVIPFHTGILPERPLEGEGRGDREKGATRQPEDPLRFHS